MIEVERMKNAFALSVEGRQEDQRGMDRKHVYFIGGVVLGVAVIAIAGKWAYDKFDVATKLHLRQLEPSFRKKVIKFLKKAKKAGYDLRITSSFRDCNKQNQLYAQGRTTPGKVITNARCGKSAHNYRIAVDLIQYRDGKPWGSWDAPNWEPIGRIAENVGIEWGGRFRSFKDPIHFQDLQGKPIAQRYADYQRTGKLA